ncbi:MAG: hypothetical protein RMK29_05125 [Myxococcales bacterium]|nr:S1 family peptidase [Myxococcota bacterium]MDW8281072.1 hypothetical protein [Myxococcales bacterium]
MRTFPSPLAATLGALIALSAPGCGPPDSADDPVPPRDGTAAAGATLDELLAEVGRRAPAFGGLFVDEQGELRLYVVPPTGAGPQGALLSRSERLARAEVVDAIATVLGPGRLPRGGLEVLPARFSFLRLKELHDRAWPHVLTQPGVVFTDIDEARNRLRIGLGPTARRADLEALLLRLGVPAEAVILDEVAEVEPVATLRDRVRPLVGGLQINFTSYLCTLGFVAVRSGVTGFVTNSHCTARRGTVEGTVYYQPIGGTTNRIGVETADPPFFTGGVCPAGRVCRYSDSAFARLDQGVAAERGSLARTNLSSIDILGSYRITSEAATVTPGEVLNKVGRTTGRTQGAVSSTCINTNVAASSITMICQTLVNAGVGGGDSGSPVFRILNNNNTPDVTLYGVLWGGTSNGTQFVFSPIANVERPDELGPLSTCTSGSC